MGARVAAAARGPRGRDARPRPRARALHAALPARRLPVDAQPHRAARMQLLRSSLPRPGTRASARTPRRSWPPRRRCSTRFARLTAGPLSAMRIRCHGDLHLGQMLFTGRDFMIIDFEGEPARSLERPARQAQPRCATWPGCCARSTTPPSPPCSTQSARGLVEPDSDAARDLELWGRAWNDAVSLGVPRRLPGDLGRRRLAPRVPRRPQRAARHLAAREGRLRAHLRAQQPPARGCRSR